MGHTFLDMKFAKYARANHANFEFWIHSALNSIPYYLGKPKNSSNLAKESLKVEIKHGLNAIFFHKHPPNCQE